MIGHADLLERRRDRPPVVRPGSPEPPERRVAAHHHHVVDRHREAPVDELGLGDVGDAPRLLPGRVAEDLDAAVPWPEQSRHELEERDLPAPFGPTTASSESGLDREVHVLERDPVAVAGRRRRTSQTSEWARAWPLSRPASTVCQPPLGGVVVGMGVRIERHRGDPSPARLERGHDPLDVPADQALVRVDRRVAERVVVEVALDLDAGLVGDRLREVGLKPASVNTAFAPDRLIASIKRGYLARRRVLAGHLDDRADDLQAVGLGEVRERLVERDTSFRFASGIVAICSRTYLSSARRRAAYASPPARNAAASAGSAVARASAIRAAYCSPLTRRARDAGCSASPSSPAT